MQIFDNIINKKNHLLITVEEFVEASVLKAPPQILSTHIKGVVGCLPELVAQGTINQSV